MRAQIPLAVSLAFVAFACDKDANPQPPPDTGTIELSWQVGLGVACDDISLGRSLSTVHLVARAGGVTVSTATFSCSLGIAAVSVPVGVYDLTLADSVDNPRFTGVRTNVVVAKNRGQRVKIILYKNPGPAGPLSLQWALPTSLPCAALGIDKVHIDLIKDQTVQAFAADFDCNGTATLTDITFGSYVIYAEARNGDGHSLFRGMHSIDFDGPAGAPVVVQLAE